MDADSHTAWWVKVPLGVTNDASPSFPTKSFGFENPKASTEILPGDVTAPVGTKTTASFASVKPVMFTISAVGASTDTEVAAYVVPRNANVERFDSERLIQLTVNDALPRTTSPTASRIDDDSQVAEENERLTGPVMTSEPIAL